MFLELLPPLHDCAFVKARANEFRHGLVAFRLRQFGETPQFFSDAPDETRRRRRQPKLAIDDYLLAVAPELANGIKRKKTARCAGRQPELTFVAT